MLQKRELEPISVGEADHLRPTLPRSLHSPQVATAARPPLRTVWLVARRSWRLAPVAPPAPAGSFLVILYTEKSFHMTILSGS